MPVRTRTVTELMATAGHEQVVYVAEREVGLRAIIAIHSTALGPSLGGVRFWHYAQRARRARRRARASEAMTRKASIAGLHQGGGKAVVHVGRAGPPAATERCCTRSVGRSTSSAAGTSRRRTSARRPPTWTRSPRSRRGSPGSTSRAAARATRRRSPRSACCTACTRCARTSTAIATLRDRRVVVQGAGHVGSHLGAAARRRRARDVVVSRSRPRRVPTRSARRARRRGRSPPTTRSTTPCDMLAPYALGGVLDDRDRRAAAVPRGRRRGEQPARDGRRRRDARGARRALRARLRRRAPAGSSTSPRSSPATTAQRALERAAGIEATIDPGARRRRGPRASPRSAPPRSSPTSGSREEGARPPLAARRSRRLDQRRPPHPPAPDAPSTTRVVPAELSACCRCGRASSGRAGATR